MKLYDKVVVADMIHLPFKNDSFDLSLSGYDALNHLPFDKFREFIGINNLRRISHQFAFDVLTNESEDFILSEDLGFIVKRIKPGWIRSFHETNNGTTSLDHYLYQRDTMNIAISAGMWRVVQEVPVILESGTSIPGHLASLLQRI